MSRKYALPSPISAKVTQSAYERWLLRKAQAHVKRDRERGNRSATGAAYREAIHLAVVNSNGCDAYTGEELDWSLISKYDNDSSKDQGRAYKHAFALLPTVDHVADGTSGADFKICGWRTNDAKHDLDLEQFTAFCRTFLEYQGYEVAKRKS